MAGDAGGDKRKGGSRQNLRRRARLVRLVPTAELLADTRQRKRLAILVSRYDHCLLDLLWRWQRGELEGEVVLVASNHPDLRAAVEGFGLPYHHVPLEPSKAEAEARLLDVLKHACDLVVLARYMQILSKEFLEQVEVPLITIHHSLLPAFAGAEPSRRSAAAAQTSNERCSPEPWSGTARIGCCSTTTRPWCFDHSSAPSPWRPGRPTAAGGDELAVGVGWPDTRLEGEARRCTGRAVLPYWPR